MLQFSSLQNLELLLDHPLQIKCLLYSVLPVIAKNFSLSLKGPPNLHEMSRRKPSVGLKIGYLRAWAIKPSILQCIDSTTIELYTLLQSWMFKGITTLQIAAWICQHLNIHISLQDRAKSAECARLNSAHQCEEHTIIRSS